jgi:DNA-binding MarR family transcriptional regulator
MTTTESPRRLSIPFDVHRISRFVADLVQGSLKGQPIGGVEFALYSYLLVAGPARISEIAEGVATPVATTSKQIDRMEERGHAERIPNPEDGRSTLVRLTDEGVAVHRAAGPGFGAALHRLEVELGDARTEVTWALTRLDHALRRVLDHEAEDPVPDKPGHSIGYEGPALTAAEEDAVREHIRFLQWQRDER